MTTRREAIESQIATKKKELANLEKDLKAVTNPIVTRVTRVGYLSDRNLIVDVDDGQGTPREVIIRFGSRTLSDSDTQVYRKV